MADSITGVWPKGSGPFCGNSSPFTGECIIGCVRQYGGCIHSPEDREAANAKRRAAFANEKEGS